MFRKPEQRAGFTLIELLIVVIIITVIAAFGVPGFSKTIVRAKARDAMNNLIVLQAAQALYKASEDTYLTADSLTALNTGLSLKLIANSATYACDATTCTATLDGNIITLTLDSPVNRTTETACTTSTANPCCSDVTKCP